MTRRTLLSSLWLAPAALLAACAARQSQPPRRTPDWYPLTSVRPGRPRKHIVFHHRACTRPQDGGECDCAIRCEQPLTTNDIRKAVKSIREAAATPGPCPNYCVDPYYYADTEGQGD